MKVDHIVPSIGDVSSGPSQSIPAMCNGLVRAGLDVTLHTLEKLPVENADDFLFAAKEYPLSWCPVRTGLSYPMKRGLVAAAKQVDILHNHSMWMFPNVYPGTAVKQVALHSGKIYQSRDLTVKKCKLVHSPRGCLTPYSLARSKWKKRIMWAIGQGAMMKRVDMFHATCENEVEDIRRLGFRQPIVLLPNGITIPPAQSNNRTIGQSNNRTIIYLSRIHPEKRLDLLLDAWRWLEKKYPNWELKVYGPVNDDFARQMKVRGESLPRCRFMGEVTGEAKWSAYRAADLFILPTRTENFGMAIAEALACGVPVITTKGAPWAGLASSQSDIRTSEHSNDDSRSGWWVDETLEAVRDALDHAMSLPVDQLRAMGTRGREWMKRDYDWDMLGLKMKAAYEWLLDPAKAPKPEWVVSS